MYPFHDLALTATQGQSYRKSTLPRVGWPLLQERKHSLRFNPGSQSCRLHHPATVPGAREQEEGYGLGCDEPRGEDRVSDRSAGEGEGWKQAFGFQVCLLMKQRIGSSSIVIIGAILGSSQTLVEQPRIASRKDDH